MNFQFDVEGTNSNRHGGGKEEDINLAKTLRKLQTKFHSHKADNEKIMMNKEQQEDFNMNLKKILDRI
jgi:hypothetical protein